MTSGEMIRAGYREARAPRPISNKGWDHGTIEPWQQRIGPGMVFTPDLMTLPGGTATVQPTVSPGVAAWEEYYMRRG